MKKTILLLLVMILTFAGCGNQTLAENAVNEDAPIQTVYDDSRRAEEYAKKLFVAMLEEKGITDYEIKQTNGGFLTDDPVVYIAGYCYTYGGTEAVYGYKLTMNDDHTFSILEEGTETGKFIMGTEDPD